MTRSVAAASPANGRKLTAPAARTPGIARIALESLVEEPHHLRVLLVAGGRKVDAGGQDAFAREARIDAAERPEAPQHQPGADEQDDGERDLRNDEDLPEPPRPRSRAALARALLERLLDVGARAGEGRGQAADRGRQDRDQCREAEDGRAQAHAPEGREVRRREGDEELHAPAREEQAEGAAEKRQKQVLRHELPQDPRPRGAERRPDRELPDPGGPAREQQARHVGARDEQNERHRSEENEEDRPHLARTSRGARARDARSSPCRGPETP